MSKHIGKYKNLVILFVFAFTVLVFYKYSVKPANAFGMIENWNYINEVKVNNIIRSQNLKNFNVVNLDYDTLAHVQKYLLTKDGIEGNWDDYTNNNYLFVVSNEKNYEESNAYEFKSFVEQGGVSEWKINETYTLYLLKRNSCGG